jgi:hypothetical protein
MGECENTGDAGRGKKDCSYLGARTVEHKHWGYMAVVYNNDGGGFNSPATMPPYPDFGSGKTAWGGSDGNNDYVPWRNYGFGSLHPSVFNVLLGDGSVRSVSKTINMTLIVKLSRVNDGEFVILP